MVESLAEYKYPHFSYIKNLLPRPEILLGREIYWTEKRDGSCLGLGLTADGEWLMRSRKRDDAANDMKAAFLDSGWKENVGDLIEHERDFGGSLGMIILSSGKS